MYRWRASLRVLTQQGDELKRQKLRVRGLEEEHWTSGTQQDAHEFLVALLAYLQVHNFSKYSLFQIQPFANLAFSKPSFFQTQPFSNRAVSKHHMHTAVLKCVLSAGAQAMHVCMNSCYC